MKKVNHNLQETYYEIGRQAQHLLEAEYSTILLEEEGELKRVYSSNMTLATSGLRKNGRTYDVFKTGQIRVAPVNSAADINPKQLKLQVRSIVFIPLICKQGKIGVLNVLSRKMPPFTEKEMHLIEVLSSLACLSIMNARLFEENKHLLSTRELFFSAASHELKTPLTTIKLYSQLLHSAIVKKQLPKSDWTNILIKEISRVTRLVNEFWLTDQIKTGHLVYNKKLISLETLIKEATMEFQSIYSQNIIYESKVKDAEILVYGDFDRLLGALTNILNNAGKYSPRDSSIFITLQQDEGNFVVQIKDNGMGIAPKNMKRIFEAFYKGGTMEGIGIGLYLAKRIIDAHAGKITVASKMGQGTLIQIYLPEHPNKYEFSRNTG